MKTLITAALLTISSLSAHSAFAQQKEASPVLTEAPAVLAVPGGRFVFGRPKPEGDQYLLDTQTGRLWYIIIVQDKNHDKVQALQPVLFLSEDGTQKSTPEEADKPKTK